MQPRHLYHFPWGRKLPQGAHRLAPWGPWAHCGPTAGRTHTRAKALGHAPGNPVHQQPAPARASARQQAHSDEHVLLQARTGDPATAPSLRHLGSCLISNVSRNLQPPLKHHKAATETEIVNKDPAPTRRRHPQPTVAFLPIPPLRRLPGVPTDVQKTTPATLPRGRHLQTLGGN